MRFIILSAVVSILLMADPGKARAEVLTWDCLFEYRVDEGGRKPEEMRLLFKVDTLSQRALMEGNNGIVDVELHVGDEAFSFIEKVGSGVAQSTTITRNGDAVHSRNTVMLGQFIAAQHFGRCRFE